MIPPLSPAAQAVLDALHNTPVNSRQVCDGKAANIKLASALRAAANEIKPHVSRTPWLTNDDGYFNETFENLEALGELNTCLRLLAIADELEGHQ